MHLPTDYRSCHPRLNRPDVVGAALRTRGCGRVLNVLVDGTHGARTFPTRVSLPDIGSLPVTLEETEAPVAHAFSARERPVRPGASLSPVGHLAGTACAVVRRPVGVGRSNRYLLSCEHVLFPEFKRNTPQPILQPAASDGAEYPVNVIGHQFARGGLYASGINDVDAAIVRLNRDVTVSNQPVSEVFTLSGTSAEFGPGQSVTLYGRSSGRLQGVIVDASIDATIGYDSAYGMQTLRFSRLVRCQYDDTPRGGDSGAPVVLAGTSRLLGMHIGGGSGFGFFCRIDAVFMRLHIGLY